MPGGRWFSEEEVRGAVADSRSYAEALRRLGLRAAGGHPPTDCKKSRRRRRLGLRAAGGNHRTIRKYVDAWRIPVDHFAAGPAPGASGKAIPLGDVLVEG